MSYVLISGFTPEQLDEFGRAFARVQEMAAQLGQEIKTERELLFLQIGLRASHIEEALTESPSKI
jgi:hypothetical protein